MMAKYRPKTSRFRADNITRKQEHERRTDSLPKVVKHMEKTKPPPIAFKKESLITHLVRKKWKCSRYSHQ